MKKICFLCFSNAYNPMEFYRFQLIKIFNWFIDSIKSQLLWWSNCDCHWKKFNDQIKLMKMVAISDTLENWLLCIHLFRFYTDTHNIISISYVVTWHWMVNIRHVFFCLPRRHPHILCECDWNVTWLRVERWHATWDMQQPNMFHRHTSVKLRASSTKHEKKFKVEKKPTNATNCTPNRMCLIHPTTHTTACDAIRE